MTRKEVIELLNRIAAVHNWRPSDAKGIVDSWCMAFGEYEAETIYKAARYVMENSPYLPKIADIKRAIGRGEMQYTSPPKAPAIAGRALDKSICYGKAVCPYYELDLCDASKEEVSICHI